MNFKNFENHYGTLELDFKSTKNEIRDKYKKLALQFHPDKNNNPYAEEYFKKMKKAYETLYDDKEREKYDIKYLKVLNYRAKKSARARETKMDTGNIEIPSEVVRTGLLLAGGVIVGGVIWYGLKLLFEDNDSKENEDDNEDGTKTNTSSIPKK